MDENFEVAIRAILSEAESALWKEKGVENSKAERRAMEKYPVLSPTTWKLQMKVQAWPNAK